MKVVAERYKNLNDADRKVVWVGKLEGREGKSVCERVCASGWVSASSLSVCFRVVGLSLCLCCLHDDSFCTDGLIG